jgi:hypothetical protein
MSIASGEECTLEPKSDDAYRLHEKAEIWQHLAMRQQEVALALHHLVSEQRALAGLLDAADANELTARARDIEAKLRDISSSAVSLERAALDKASEAIAEEARALRLRPNE